VKALLELQRQQADEDVVLSLIDGQGKPFASRLAVRIAETSMSDITCTVEQAKTAEQQLAPPQVAEMSGTVTMIADTISFGPLLDKVKGLLKVGSEVAKIHPYINFAWQVLSAGLNMVNTQRVRDEKIMNLVRIIDTTYSLIAAVEQLEGKLVQDIVEQILKQTIECGYFIQEYVQHNFAGRAVLQPFLGTDDTIANCQYSAGSVSNCTYC